MQKNFIKTLILGLTILGVLMYLAFGKDLVRPKPETSNKPAYQPTEQGATTYEECVAEGGVMIMIYPGQCTAKNGKSFTQDIGNEMEKSDLIISENPRPGEVVTSPLIIEGQARGTWFFEANFSITVEDENGNVLATTVATALDEWMTTEFVPFTATATFEKTATKKGTLVLHKANASDLEDNEDSLIVPIYFY
jgi:hypothetical protein